jgi:F-type H+-transporting ATPase subunit delta
MGRTKEAARDAKELFRLCLVNGLLDEGRVHDVVRHVTESRNRNRFRVLSRFERLVRLDVAKRTATVANATRLSPDMQACIQADLSRSHGPGLNTTFTQDPALIGGMRIKVGCDVYDGSVKARLAALQACFS